MAKPLKVGMFGFGVIGTGVARTLSRNGGLIAQRLGRRVELRRIVDVDIERDRGVRLNKGVLSKRAEDILDDPEIEVVVEVIGGVKHARPIVEAALAKGKHVVTANKELISKHGPSLLALAGKSRAHLKFEASVGGGIPILTPLSSCLKANRIKRVACIINGTTNYILGRMDSAGLDFQTALAEAQRLGYAEADPTNDIEGFDSVYKAGIIAGLIYGKSIPVKSVHREGITHIDRQDMIYAAEMGYAIKLLAHVAEGSNGRVDIRVHPTLLPQGHPLSKVDGVLNGVWIEADPLGTLLTVGEGAGPSATSSAVIGDILMIAESLSAGGEIAPACVWEAGEAVPIGDMAFPFYSRMIVKDQAGVMADITKELGKGNVSLSSMVQKARLGRGLAEVVWITHKAGERAVQESMKAIRKLKAVKSVANIIRVLDEKL